MSSGSIRIIQLPEKSSVNTDDYMAVDSSANGTKKVKFTDLLDDNLSVQNKAADAQATGEAISELNTNIDNTNTRIDNMINTQQNASVTTLWTGRINLKNETANLSESISNFDFVDVYCGGADTVFARKPVANSIAFELQSQNMSDDASVQFMRWWETGLTISGTTATINKAIRCFWDDFSTAPIVSQATGGGIDIVRIDGVKIGHVENDEIVDARVGADGVTYPTLGDAIRGQVTDLESDFIANDAGATLVNGYYISYRDGAVSALGSAKYIEVDVSLVDMIYYKNTMATPDLRGLAFYDSDGTFISGVQIATTPQTIAVPNNAITVKATVKEANQVGLLKNAKDIIDLVANQKDYTDTQISNLVNSESPTITEISGKYIYKNGNLENSNSFSICQPFTVTAGKVIKFKAAGYDTNIAMISRYNSNGTYTPLVVCTDSNVNLYSYTVLENMNVVVCWIHSQNHELTVENSLEAISEVLGSTARYTNIMAMFNQLVCIGDSLTESLVYTSASASRRAYQTYPDILGKITGTETEWFARGGYTAKAWWNAFNADCFINRINPCYIVYLGTNGGLTDTIDTDCPIGTDISTWGDTQTGYYGRILQRIADLNGKAILVKVYASDGDVSVTNSVIEKFGKRYSFPVLENKKFTDNLYHYYPDKSGTNSVHYNDIGYERFTEQLLFNISNLGDNDLLNLLPN